MALWGTVNSRNRFSGYTGPQPFIISNDGIFIGEAATADLVFKHCRGGASTELPLTRQAQP